MTESSIPCLAPNSPDGLVLTVAPEGGGCGQNAPRWSQRYFQSTFILVDPKVLHSDPYYGGFCCGTIPFSSALASS